jgi:hypothetical protein
MYLCKDPGIVDISFYSYDIRNSYVKYSILSTYCKFIRLFGHLLFSKRILYLSVSYLMMELGMALTLLQCIAQAFDINWLQYVINSTKLKSIYSKLIICCDKNNFEMSMELKLLRKSNPFSFGMLISNNKNLSCSTSKKLFLLHQNDTLPIILISGKYYQ